MPDELAKISDTVVNGNRRKYPDIKPASSGSLWESSATALTMLVSGIKMGRLSMTLFW
jgi:hypothetical protein